MEVRTRKTIENNSKSDRKNSNKWAWILGAIPLFLFALIAWGLIEPYVLKEEEEDAVIPNLPIAWEGKKVAQLSDFQLGMWWDNAHTVSKSVDRIIEQQADAVFITGDFIYHAKPEAQVEINEITELLRPLTEAGIPTYAVLGNHDYGMSSKTVEPDSELAAQLDKSLESVGITVLNNEAEAIPLENQASELYVVGVDSHWANSDKAELALGQISDDTPRVVMVHNPDSFIDFPANTAPFAMAGHTHGGQIRLPYSPQWSWLSLAKKDKVVADGWIESKYGQSGNNLYVNRGIGFSDVPIRINCAPELTFFTLKSQ